MNVRAEMRKERDGRGWDDCPLLHAVRKNRLEAAQFLLERGAINDGYIGLAVSTEMMDLLLDYGADINGYTWNLYSVCRYTYIGRIDLVQHAMLSGLDINRTGMQFAMASNAKDDTDMFKFLIQIGVDVNAPRPRGWEWRE